VKWLTRIEVLERPFDGFQNAVAYRLKTEPADLAPPDPAHPYAWRSWTVPWTATPGRYELVVRAGDAGGRQPLEQEWNRQGMANNLVQRVPVTVLVER
jgi:DMSO/TMAO reductase YedYZ molybdopterin-dependent catalytic subunit